MKNLIIVGVAVVGVFFAGCGKKTAENSAPTPAVASNTVVVAIGDAKLMSADLEADVAKVIEARMAQIPPEQLKQIPPDQLDAGKKRMAQQFAEQFKQQFIMKTLLLNEAAKKGITITDEDVKAWADEVIKSSQGRPGAPATLDELLAGHPLGVERARAEFNDSVLIKKFAEKEFGSKVVVDSKEVENQYNQILSNITQRAKAPRPEQVRASHILIKADEKKTSEAAKKEIDELHTQLKDLKGEELAKKFGELARAKSDCSSKAKGGDLGVFGHGQMVPEFDKAAFEQKIGQLYAPVKTSFGWHLILVTEKIPAKTPTDADVAKAVAEQMPKKEEIERGMKNQQIQQKFQEYVQGLLEVNGFAAPVGQPQPAAHPPAPPPKPTKVIESKPVELKPTKK